MSDEVSEQTADSNSQDMAIQHATVHPAVRICSMIVAGGVAAAVCSFAIGAVGEFYPTPQEVLSLGAAPTDAERAAAGAAKRVADTGNAMAWLAICGAIMGGLLSLTTGIVQRAGAKSVVGTLAGTIAGGCLGLLSGKLAVAYYASVTASLLGATSNAEQQFMMMHGMTWGLIGIGVGLGCGLSRSSIEIKTIITSIVVAGVLGGVAGGLFPIILGVAAPLISSASPIAEPGTGQFIWIGLAGVLMGAGLGRAS